MADWRLPAGILAIAALAGAGGAAWDRLRPPRTPRELFQRRCSHCHELPRMNQFGKRNMAGIVRTMRTHNGADKVITEQEAAVIVKYLEGVARW